MKVFETIEEVRRACSEATRQGKPVGFVPTMGALHAGHISLVAAARRDCSFVVVSIFVNPTQFGPNEDLSKYPRPREVDLDLCRQAGVDAVFYPSVTDIYPPGFCTFVEVSHLSSRWEGAARPGHFRGVATIVSKLFQMVPADRAYFGQKDYQQQAIIRQMVSDLNFPVEIIVCPTLRDPDGLALSSRNIYLSADQRVSALSLSRALNALGQALAIGERNIARLNGTMHHTLVSTAGVQLDYAVLVDPDTLEPLKLCQPKMTALIAAKVGTTRLIDNAVFKVNDQGLARH